MQCRELMFTYAGKPNAEVREGAWTNDMARTYEVKMQTTWT